MKKNYDWIKRFRVLTQMLIFSGAVNIAFLCCFVYLVFLKDRPLGDYAVKPVILEQRKKDVTNSQYLSYISGLSFRELLLLLSNKQLLEEGYTKRDLTLGCLYTFHDFNIEKALPNHPLQKRVVSFQKGAEKCEVTIFAGLLDHHYEGIIHYATTDKWPLTSKGLFSALKKWEKPRDSSLEKAVMLTEEYYVISNLFNQEDLNLKSSDLLDLLCQTPWEFLEEFVKKQNMVLDVSRERRVQFLLGLQNSSLAADLLLKVDLNYAAKRLGDDQVLKILALVHEQNKQAERFCVELLLGSRSDLVWKAAAVKLYEFAKEKIPENLDQKEVMRRFVNSEELKNKWKKEEPQRPTLSAIVFAKDSREGNMHTVKDGENLWKIARKYKVDVEDLIKVNKLKKNERIHPGKKIIIPKNS